MTKKVENTQPVDYGEIMKYIIEKDGNYGLGDLAKVLGKDITTVRRWEREGKIEKSKNRNNAGRRVYTRKEFTDIIEDVLDEPNLSRLLHNPGEIQLLVIYLRGV